MNFDIDANSVLSVRAKDKNTGKEQKIRIEASSGLSDAEIDKCMNPPRSTPMKTRRFAGRIDKLNQAEGLIFSTKKLLKEHKDELTASVGYYYQYRSQEHVNGSGLRGRLAYNLTNGLTVGTNLSYDQAFEARVSADLKYRFGANGYGALSFRKRQPVVMSVIQVLTGHLEKS